MHAKHADNSEMNGLPKYMIGCVTIKCIGARQKRSWLMCISFGELRLAIKRVAHGI